METIINFLQNNIMMVAPTAATAIILFVARIFPKEKALAAANKCEYFGKLISTIGNTKIGKSAMSKLEEGAIVTLLGFASTCITSFARGLTSDNTTDK